MTAAGRKYLREVKKQVLSQGDERTRYLNAMENRTIEYVQQNPTATVDELCQKIGDFDSIGQQQLEECPQKKLIFFARSGNTAWKWLRILGVTTLLVAALAAVCIAVDNNKYQNGYEEDTIIIVPD